MNECQENRPNVSEDQKKKPTFRFMWIKRIINSSDNQWKVIPLTYISLIGGKKSI